MAASHRARAVVGHTATGGRAHFSYIACVHMVSFAAWKLKLDEGIVEKIDAKAGGAPVPGQAGPVEGSTATGRIRTGDLCDDI